MKNPQPSALNLTLQYTTHAINWELVVHILQQVGMAYYAPSLHALAFNNSHTVVFAFDGTTLIGFGRAISDGAYQAAIYDVAVLPSYQGMGIGKIIMNSITTKLPNSNCILYAAIGKEPFYEKLQFKKMKTGMALFANAQLMQAKGFTE